MFIWLLEPTVRAWPCNGWRLKRKHGSVSLCYLLEDKDYILLLGFSAKQGITITFILISRLIFRDILEETNGFLVPHQGQTVTPLPSQATLNLEQRKWVNSCRSSLESICYVSPWSLWVSSIQKPAGRKEEVAKISRWVDRVEIISGERDFYTGEDTGRTNQGQNKWTLGK